MIILLVKFAPSIIKKMYMDFVLQFGEFYSEGVSQNIIMTTLVSLIPPFVAVILYIKSVNN